MKWFRTKPEDKLWREIWQESNRGLGLYLIIGLTFCSAILFTIRRIFDIKGEIYASYSIWIPILIPITLGLWQFQRVLREICRRLQKQDEFNDKIKKILGIAEPSYEIKALDKEKLIDSLLNMLDNEDNETRKFTAQTLGELGNMRVLPALSKLLSDSDKSVVSAAMSSIEKLTVKA